ncbi:MAG: peptidase M48, partial [Bacteroides sp.]
MKQLIISFLLTAITIGTYAQRQDLSRDFAINGTLKSDYGNYPKGTPIVLRKVIKMSNQPNQSTNGIMMAIEVNGMQYPFPVDIANKIHFTPENQQQFWQSVFLHEGMYQHYDNKGYRYELRQELNEEANQYLSELSGL